MLFDLKQQLYTTVSITHNIRQVICFQFLLVQSRWRHGKYTHILCCIHFSSTPCLSWKQLYLQKAVKHHGPTSTTFQVSCKIKFYTVILIFPLLKHCPGRHHAAHFLPKQWPCSQTSLAQVKPSAGLMMAAEALALCLAAHNAQEGMSGCSGDTSLLPACDLCPLAARHPTVYEAVSVVRSSGSELMNGWIHWWMEACLYRHEAFSKFGKKGSEKSFSSCEKKPHNILGGTIKIVALFTWDKIKLYFCKYEKGTSNAGI